MEGGSCQNSVSFSDSIDKSRIVDVKPLRSLAPVFPESAQASPSGQYPYGFSPFWPFGVTQESRASPAPVPAPAPIRSFRSPLFDEETPHGANGDGSSSMEGLNGVANDQNRAAPHLRGGKPSPAPMPAPTRLRSFRSPPFEEATLHGANGDSSSSMEGLNDVANDQNSAAPHFRGSKSSPPIPAPTPLRSFRSPLVEQVNLRGANADASSSMEGLNGVANAQKRSTPNLHSNKSSQKRNKVTRESDIDSSSLVVISLDKKDDGDRESVNVVLMTFDALRRRLCQLEDAKELNTNGFIKRADLRASNALTCKGIRTNMRKRVGVVPGVDIGDIFYFRMELCLVGLHGQSMGGIDYMTVKSESQEEPVALSIVSSGEYDDDAEDNDILVYSGQGEHFNKKDKHVTDQKLQRGNLALDRSSQRHNEVRVIRGLKDATNKNSKIYVYDGLYKIQDSWIERGKSGGGIFKYKFVRLHGQPSAFAVWKLIQKWKEGSPSRRGLIIADLSSGAESVPVSLVNDVDDEKGPAFFTYFNSLKHPKPLGSMLASYGCNCNKACIPGDLNCSCIQRNAGDFPYTANGILVSRKQLVHECGPMCHCLPNCKNRISQTGLKHYMEVFKTKDRGWGLRSLDPIRAGTFICEYAGEVVDGAKLSVNGKERDNDEYIFDTSRIYEPLKWNYEPSLLEEGSSGDCSEDYDIQSPLIISAEDVGNVARFMNHSCSPNVFWQPVLYQENNQSFLHIAFFALRHIPPMTELTYDYGITCSGQANGGNAAKGRKCLCGSPKCRGSFG